MNVPAVPPAKNDTLVRRHNWLWNRFIANRTTRRQARLSVIGEAITSVYRTEHNEIIIGLGGWDLEAVPDVSLAAEVPVTPSPGGWPIWERDLHHEFVHEYEDKVIAGRVSQDDVELAQDHTMNRRFPEEGHGPTFHAAAAEIARALGINLKAFIEAI